MVVKTGRFGSFLSCANYPACDFVSWDRVIPEPCPVCGAHVVVKAKRGGARLQCSADAEHDVSALPLPGSNSGEERELVQA